MTPQHTLQRRRPSTHVCWHSSLLRAKRTESLLIKGLYDRVAQLLKFDLPRRRSSLPAQWDSRPIMDSGIRASPNSLVETETGVLDHDQAGFRHVTGLQQYPRRL